MKRIYANLLGVWTDITEDGLIEKKAPIQYYNEEWEKITEYDYVNVGFEDKNYRIHPSMLQVVTG